MTNEVDSPWRSYKPHFARFLGAAEGRLHFAAHSHHLWPDVTEEAHAQVWRDAARSWDAKWERILGEVVPACQRGVATVLGLSRPEDLVFAPNTHELVNRILSHWTARVEPVTVLTTDGEFHSFRRQCRRLEEAGRLRVERVAVEPFASFAERFRERAASGEHELVFASHVFFNSGFVHAGLEALVQAVSSRETLVVIDGYHAFMALPTNLAPIEGRAFYLGGGYKYAMSGEGACFAHCPPGFVERPVNTGWFAGFGELEDEDALGPVGYGTDGTRLAGSTFDPSGLYRMRAVLAWFEEQGLTVAQVHARVQALQRRFLDGLAALELPWLNEGALIPPTAFAERGHFLTFRTPLAETIHRTLLELDEPIVTDHRGRELRFGFGLYHDPEDVDELCRRLGSVALETGAH